MPLKVIHGNYLLSKLPAYQKEKNSFNPNSDHSAQAPGVIQLVPKPSKSKRQNKSFLAEVVSWSTCSELRKVNNKDCFIKTFFFVIVLFLFTRIHFSSIFCIGSKVHFLMLLCLSGRLRITLQITSLMLYCL